MGYVSDDGGRGMSPDERMMTAAQHSTVELFELFPNGAAFSWTDDRSRAIALEMFVELARRLEGKQGVERLRLSSALADPIDAADPIDVTDTSAFVRTAPLLLRQRYQAFRLEFRLNGGARPYGMQHLDQSAKGFWFFAPVTADALMPVLELVLAAFARRDTGVRISTGAWFGGDRS